MQQDKVYIAGDWGTTNLRLSLVDSIDGHCIAKSAGPGIGAISSDAIADMLDGMTEAWVHDYGVKRAVLCGMVGSNIGWTDAGYVDCPLPLEQLQRQFVETSSTNLQVSIVPGIRCRNPIGAVDIMRGEETQLLGALSKNPNLYEGNQLVCMPGTHSKWVFMQDSVVENFTTSVSGELFSILAKHSVLARGAEPDYLSSQAFSNGVLRSAENMHVDLNHLLFETRSRQIAGQLVKEDAQSFLSGLIIGRDIMGARRMFADVCPASDAITFISNPKLNGLYQHACDRLNITCETLDGDHLTRAGIHVLVRGGQNDAIR